MFNEIKSLYLGKCVLCLFLLCFSSVIIAQTSNWTNVKETNINVANANPAGVDIFTNRYGSHIIVQESNILRYYKMNVNGIAGSPVTIENSAVVSPSISGDADNIYIVYGIGNQVRVKRSTNGGSTWNLWTPTFSLSTNVAELGLESVISSGKIHVTYLESGVVRYRYRNLNENVWSGVKEVSNGETGNFPRITSYKNAQVQMDYVYFMYRKFNGVDYDCKWRRYNVANDSWHTPIYTAPIVLNPGDVTDNFRGIRTDNQNVVIYFQFHKPQPFQYYFAWINLDLNNNGIGYGYADLSIENYRMYSTPTADGKTHTVLYWEHLGEGYSDIGLWRSFIADTHPSDQFYEYELPQIDAVKHLNLSSAGNEVHVIWKDPFGSNQGNNLRYKFDDQVPIAPQNLTVTKSQNNHPLLSWLPNPEPDLNIYKIYRRNACIGDWEPNPIGSTGNLSYEDLTQSYCTAIPPAQCENLCNFEYRIKAVDQGSKYSDYSNTVSAWLVGGPPQKAGINDPAVETVFEYSLCQNYPNPFNPTTTINYSIKTTGLSTLKVYDMLGVEVASLVNENQEAGNYSVTFNASELPSGIYFYTLTSGNFIVTKKLILLR